MSIKNLTTLLFILALTLPANANQGDHVYPYANTNSINGSGNIIKCKEGREYINVPARNTTNPFERMMGIGAAAGVGVLAASALFLDPYVINIDGINYVMVKDKTDGIWSEHDLLGYEDPKENRFESLIKLNSDTDYSRITADELRKAKIRFVRMDSKGVLMVKDRNQDFDLKKIDYIDIINLKRTANSESTGIFGHFTVYLKTTGGKKRAVVGYVTYETDKKIEYLFK